jgi:glycosyltransferase involved in cell wall biosynthesis
MRRMSTLLCLCPYVPHPPTHGGSIRSRVLLEAMVLDHTVHVAVPIAGPTDRTAAQALARALPVTVHELPVPATTRPDFTKKLAAWARGRSELLARRFGDRAAPVAAALARSVRPDLLVVDSSFALPLVPAIDVPSLLHLHNLESTVFARADAARRSFADRITRQFEARTIGAAEREALRRAVLSVTVSAVDRDLALAMVPDANVLSVPNSVDLDRLPLLPPPPSAPPEPLRLLFVGTVDYPPNHEAIVELVEQHLPVLRQAFPQLVVRLVGRDEAGRLAAFRGRPGVEVVGPVDDLLPHYAQSHVVYLPIRSGGGTRIKILEAWALGRPVLATAVGAEALEGRDGVHWWRVETPQQGAQLLGRLQTEGVAAMVAAARRLVEASYSHRAAIAGLRAAVGQALAARA